MVNSATQDSAANTEQTLTITRGNRKRIYLRHLTVSIQGEDHTADVTVDVKDDGVTVYSTVLRAGKVFIDDADLGDGIPIRNGNCTIVASAAGGATNSAITTLSTTYEII